LMTMAPVPAKTRQNVPNNSESSFFIAALYQIFLRSSRDAWAWGKRWERLKALKPTAASCYFYALSSDHCFDLRESLMVSGFDFLQQKAIPVIFNFRVYGYKGPFEKVLFHSRMALAPGGERVCRCC
jgi:hypothetical protein